ncbi:MAG: hypothetical protein AVO39_08210 [delta proteobacterium MLS_D]|jgi:putative endonuclease|nr:MAG: hypothetical protein AVO39_08210 [delta proteobacterium MLS_D]
MVTAKSTGGPSRLPSANRDRGLLGEKIAARYLQKQGYCILSSNYRCVFGEIDIIARDGDEIVFVEVKSRTSSTFGDPEVSVTLSKQKKLSRTALRYLEDHDLCGRKARFDVLAVRMTSRENTIHHIRDAFELAL